MTRAAATVTNAATDANAAADVSAADVSSAAAATNVSAATAADMSTTRMSATAATTAAVTAAASTGNSYAMDKPRPVFSIEDVEGRETDVGDFLFAQKDAPSVVLQRCIPWCGCRCTARHGERNARRS
jgi:hypothetical protein